jgi:nitrogen fixation-related uncharacterized protein
LIMLPVSLECLFQIALLIITYTFLWNLDHCL